MKKHDTSVSPHACRSHPAPRLTQPAELPTSDPGRCDGSDGALVSPLIPHIPLQPRPLDDTSSEPEETALPRDYLSKVWRIGSIRASRPESGTSETLVASEGHAILGKRPALPAEDPPATRQRTDGPQTDPSAAQIGLTDAPATGSGLRLPAVADAPVALLAYTNTLYHRLEAVMITKFAKLESEINSAAQNHHVGALLAREATEASAGRMAALERRCADLEVRALEHSAMQRAHHDDMEAAVAAVSSLIGVAAADAAAARREAAALREMAQKAYSTLLADVSSSIHDMKQQIGDLKAQQDDLAEAVAALRSATAAPAVSSESMLASKSH